MSAGIARLTAAIGCSPAVNGRMGDLGNFNIDLFQYAVSGSLHYIRGLEPKGVLECAEGIICFLWEDEV